MNTIIECFCKHEKHSVSSCPNPSDYECDSCEEPIGINDESFEVKYGFICKMCAGH